MTAVLLTCWSPECGRTFPLAPTGRPRRYCDGNCRRQAQKRRDRIANAAREAERRSAFLAATYGGQAA